MGQVFKKTTTRPVPAGATIVTKGSKLTARWKGRGSKAKWTTAEIVTLADGRQVIRQESSTYFMRYRNPDGSVTVETTGCRTEDAARAILFQAERRVERVKAGIVTPAENAVLDQQSWNIASHIDDYIGTLTGSPMHRSNTASYLRHLAADLHWASLGDMRRSDLERWLADQARRGRSARSRNAFQVAATAFGNWCVRDGRLTANPFAGLKKANVDADPRRPRRAFTPDELNRLIEAARRAPTRPKTRERSGRPNLQTTCRTPLRGRTGRSLRLFGRNRPAA